MSVIRIPATKVVKPVIRQVLGVGGSRRLPTVGLLLYLGRPNSDEYLIGEDTEIGEDTYIWGFYAGADETIRAATGWVDGTGNPLYEDNGTPRVALASEILAWTGVNESNVLFKSVSAEQQTGKLAIYALGTDAEILTKAKKVLGIE